MGTTIGNITSCVPPVSLCIGVDGQKPVHILRGIFKITKIGDGCLSPMRGEGTLQTPAAGQRVGAYGPYFPYIGRDGLKVCQREERVIDGNLRVFRFGIAAISHLILVGTAENARLP